MSSAKKRRLNRFFSRGSKRGIILPVDHGLTLGPIPGLESISKIANLLKHQEINGIIAHKGCLQRLNERDVLSHTAAMLHLNGMTSFAEDPDQKEMVSSVQTAMALGMDGVSLQLNFTGQNDSHNLRLLGAVSDQAMAVGLPVLTMLYDKAVTSDSSASIKRMRHLLRAVTELGSDMIKIALPETPQALAEMLSDVTSDVHVLVAGGALVKESELIRLLESAVRNGASGFCIGRNIFERPQAADFLQRMHQILHGRQSQLTLHPSYGARG